MTRLKGEIAIEEIVAESTRDQVVIEKRTETIQLAAGARRHWRARMLEVKHEQVTVGVEINKSVENSVVRFESHEQDGGVLRRNLERELLGSKKPGGRMLLTHKSGVVLGIQTGERRMVHETNRGTARALDRVTGDPRRSAGWLAGKQRTMGAHVG